MLLDLNRLRMQVREVCTCQRQDLGFLEEDMMISISQCVFGHHRLPQLPQTTTMAVFTNGGINAVLCSVDVNLATQARYTIYTARQVRIPSVFYQPQELC